MKTATMIREDVLGNPAGFANLYKLSEPLASDWGDEPAAEYVVVSAAQVVLSGPETYIFAADAEGNVISWGELPGSFRGGMNHAEALDRAGYSIE